MFLSREKIIKEFMTEYKSLALSANKTGTNKYGLYLELRGFYNGMTRILTYDDAMSIKEFKLIYKFMSRKLDVFYNVYVLNKED